MSKSAEKLASSIIKDVVDERRCNIIATIQHLRTPNENRSISFQCIYKNYFVYRRKSLWNPEWTSPVFESNKKLASYLRVLAGNQKAVEPDWKQKLSDISHYVDQFFNV